MIPTIITQALSRDIVELGSTHQRRDFLFVEDTAAGIEACGHTAGIEGEVINLGSGSEISIGGRGEARLWRSWAATFPLLPMPTGFGRTRARSSA